VARGQRRLMRNPHRPMNVGGTRDPWKSRWGPRSPRRTERAASFKRRMQLMSAFHPFRTIRASEMRLVHPPRPEPKTRLFI
jgi:hypothetical protein